MSINFAQFIRWLSLQGNKYGVHKRLNHCREHVYTIPFHLNETKRNGELNYGWFNSMVNNKSRFHSHSTCTFIIYNIDIYGILTVSYLPFEKDSQNRNDFWFNTPGTRTYTHREIQSTAPMYAQFSFFFGGSRRSAFEFLLLLLLNRMKMVLVVRWLAFERRIISRSSWKW